MTDITTLVEECYDYACRKGFYDGSPTIPEKLALIHSEVSEALEAARESLFTTHTDDTGKLVGFASELADIVIRVCDLAGWCGIDLAREIRVKQEYNESRPHKHGKAF